MSVSNMNFGEHNGGCQCFNCRQGEFKRRADAMVQLRADYNAHEKAKHVSRDTLPLTASDMRFLRDCGIAA